MAASKKMIKLGFDRLSHSDLAAYGLSTYGGLNGNALYPSPVISLALYLSYMNALALAIGIWGPRYNRGSKSDHVALLAARNTVELAMVQMANYCEATTPYDGDAFLNAGWQIRNAPSPTEMLPAPGDLRQVYQKNVPAGSAKLKAKKVNGAHSYLFRREPLAPETANVEYPSTAAMVIVPSLIIGQLYRFRIAAIGPKGVGVWSDVCEVRVI